MSKSEENDSSNEENVCITCSNQGECENIFILTFEGMSFSDVFISCMGFELCENSKLKYVCLECINTIVSFHKFKEAAVRSYEELRKKESKIKIPSSKKQAQEDSSESSDQILVFRIDGANIKEIETSEAESHNTEVFDVKVEVLKNDNYDIDLDKADSDDENIDKEDNSIDKDGIRSSQEDSDFDETKQAKAETFKSERFSLKELKEKNLWQCTYCNIIISNDNPAEIKRHRNCKNKKIKKIGQTRVSQDLILVCCLCCEFRTTSEEEFKEHSESHSGSDLFTTPPRKFGCIKCSYSSARKSDVERHILSHLNNFEVNLVQCSLCNFFSRYKSALGQHIRRKHKNVSAVSYNCEECEFQTPYKKCLTSHQLQHKSPVQLEWYFCSNCEFKTIHKTNLRTHMQLHKPLEQVTKFVCDICGFSSRYQQRQKSHMMAHEIKDKKVEEKEKLKLERKRKKKDSKEEMYRKDRERKRRLRERILAEGILLKCDQCNYKTYFRTHLNAHIKRHKPENEVQLFFCDQCTYKTRSKGALKDHFKTHNDREEIKVHKCEQCEFRTAYKSALNIHSLRHKEEKAFSCDQCDFKTCYKGSFTEHLARHKEPKKFKCEFCDYRSSSRSNVTRHQDVRHDRRVRKRYWAVKKMYAEKVKRIRIHECPICHRKYTKSIINEHILRHGVEKPVACKICGKGVSSNQTLKQHMMLHEGKKFTCDICNKGFTQLFLLKEHKSIHKGEKFLCSTCGMSFPNPTRLRQHQYKHKKKTVESQSLKSEANTRHICDFCGKSFSSVKTLEVHRVTHDSDKTFECARCGKKFGHRALLTSHIWLHIAEFRCQKCFKIYKKDDLKKHNCEPLPEGVVFDNFLPTECRQCGEILQDGNMDRHLKRHDTRECKICGEKVLGARKLQFHLNSHKLKCNLCGKGFAKKENHIRHMNNLVCEKINLSRIQVISRKGRGKGSSDNNIPTR